MTVLGSIFAVAIQEGIMVAGLGKTLKVDDQFVLDLNGWQIGWHCFSENFQYIIPFVSCTDEMRLNVFLRKVPLATTNE